MSDFKVIESQEQLDALIGERLKKARELTRKEFDGFLSPEEVAEKYKGYLSPEDEKKKYHGFISPSEAAEKDARIKGYESSSLKMQIAHETGLPFEMASRLSGDSEDDIRKDAENLVKLIGRQAPTAPLASTEPYVAKENDTREALKRTLKGMSQ